MELIDIENNRNSNNIKLIEDEQNVLEDFEVILKEKIKMTLKYVDDEIKRKKRLTKIIEEDENEITINSSFAVKNLENNIDVFQIKRIILNLKKYLANQEEEILKFNKMNNEEIKKNRNSKEFEFSQVLPQKNMQVVLYRIMELKMLEKKIEKLADFSNITEAPFMEVDYKEEIEKVKKFVEFSEINDSKKKSLGLDEIENDFNSLK